MKVVRVILSPQAEEIYAYLNKEASKRERTILNSVQKKVALIKENIHYGNPIAKSKIPHEYKERYGVTNLFRVELPHYWRMLYTLTAGGSEIEIIAFVLDIADHEEYDRKFKYRGR